MTCLKHYQVRGSLSTMRTPMLCTETVERGRYNTITQRTRECVCKCVVSPYIYWTDVFTIANFTCFTNVGFLLACVHPYLRACECMCVCMCCLCLFQVCAVYAFITGLLYWRCPHVCVCRMCVCVHMCVCVCTCVFVCV